MKKWKKVLAILTAVAIAVPSLSSVGNAAETAYVLTESDAAVQSEDAVSETNETPEETDAVQEESYAETADSVAEINDAETETAADDSEDANTVFEISEETAAEVDNIRTSPIIGKVDASDDGISVASLLPLTEVNAYLLLNGYSDEELQNMSVDDVLDMLLDADGNKIEISDSATTVWRYTQDETDGVDEYETYNIGSGATIDLSTEEGITTYSLELVVGSGNQLDTGNIRYLIKVYVTDTVTEEVGYELYTQDESGNRTKVVPSMVLESTNTQLGMEVTSVEYLVPSHEKGTEYYLGITSVADEHPNIQVDVYAYYDFLYMLYGFSDDSITDQILNQTMTEQDAGYKSTYDVPESSYDFDNIFVIVYTDLTTGSVTSYSMIGFCVAADASYISANLTYYEDGEEQDVVCLEANSNEVSNLSMEIGTGNVTGSVIEGHYYMLNEGYSADDEYYFSLTAHGTVYGDEANSYVTKAVVGLYDTLEDAADQEDIKDQLIPADTDTTPCGYKANYNYLNEGLYFTIFFEDGSVFKINARVMEYDPKYDEDYVRSYTDAPIVGEEDPWFQVTGAQQDGETLGTYIVENGKTINMDTMYGYGYQTVFINDADVDLSELQPIFWTASADRIEVYVNGTKIESGDTVDCSAGTVEFSVIIDDNVRNYMVSFVKKTSGAQLYVCGPDTREVFLDEYFEYKHDILIANIGDEELTGLRVELDATNCKLDDYWTVGGEGNDTLAAFTTTSSDTEYGELSNLAKIRLLPDGEGEIEGTLTVYADGMEPVVITLTGRAQNPEIVTDELRDAVKYVPYSYLITTDNMYDWTDVSFELVSGELPEGVELNTSTGEIYGVAQETGEFTIEVEASFTSDTYSFDSSTVELTLTVLENTNDNVYNETDEGYDILVSVGVDEDGTHDYVLTEYADEEFRSAGVMDEFIDLWLNGEKLVEGVDYTVESGSTRITILQQTLENKANTTGTNTIAAEFRVDGDTSKTLKRTAQNFRLNLTSDSSSSDGSGSGSGNSGSGTSGGSSGSGSSGGSSGNGTSGGSSGSRASGGSSGSSASGGSSGSGTNSGSSGTGSSGSGTTGSGTGSTGSTTSSTSTTATGVIYVVDADGNPVTDLALEIHSTVITATTSQSGYAVFNNIKFGSHTLYAKDADGNVTAQKSFTLQSGRSVSLNGSTITVPGGSAFTLTVQYDGSSLELLSVEAGSSLVSVKTGDNGYADAWLIMILTAAGIAVFARRRRSRQSVR